MSRLRSLAYGLVPAAAAFYITITHPESIVTPSQVLTISKTDTVGTTPLNLYYNRQNDIKRVQTALSDNCLSVEELFGKRDSTRVIRGSVFDFLAPYNPFIQPINQNDIYLSRLRHLVGQARVKVTEVTAYSEEQQKMLNETLHLLSNQSITKTERAQLTERVQSQRANLLTCYGLNCDSELGRELLSCIDEYSDFLQKQERNGWAFEEAIKIANNRNTNASIDNILHPIFFSLIAGALVITPIALIQGQKHD